MERPATARPEMTVDTMATRYVAAERRYIAAVEAGDRVAATRARRSQATYKGQATRHGLLGRFTETVNGLYRQADVAADARAQMEEAGASRPDAIDWMRDGDTRHFYDD